MNDSINRALPMYLTMIRWAARILSGLILLFWGFFLVAHIFGEEGTPSRPRNANDYIGLTAMVTSLVGLAVAWKSEVAGGAITLIAVFIGAIVNWQVLAFPYALIPIVAVMFLSCWWLSRPREGKIATNDRER